MTHGLKILISAFAMGALGACATPGFRPEIKLADAKINPETVTEHTLKWLPGPIDRIPIAVYGVADQTGSFQQTEGGQTLSRSVTQAPTPILIKALQDAGNHRWFSVIERENLGNLLRERQIIIDMRQRYLGETELNREALPALKFAGILIEGAITGYDTNTVTGGAGARYLGVGASTQYREDAVSVYLRAVSVKTGEVLISISTEQRVASIAAQGNAFRFVAFQELLEAEAGITLNQPRHLAVRQAFEKAVYGLIVEGAEQGLWNFGDDQAGQAAISHYRSSYARAPREENTGVLPSMFYEARQRDIERMQLARAQQEQHGRQVAALSGDAQAGQQQSQQAYRTPPPERPRQQQVNPPQQVNGAGAFTAPRPDAQPQQTGPAEAAAARYDTSQPVPATSEPVAPTPPPPAPEEKTVAVAPRSEPVRTVAGRTEKLPEPAPAAVTAEPVQGMNQAILDALAALEALSNGADDDIVITAETARSLLAIQRGGYQLATVSGDTAVDVGTRTEGAPPPP